MMTFRIDPDHKITALASAPQAQAGAERFRLVLANVLTLDGKTLPPQGAGGLVLRRVGNAENHVYACLRGFASLGTGPGAALPIPAVA